MARPFVLDPLFRSLTSLAGVGPRTGKTLEKLINGPRVADLLWHLPIDFIDRRFSPKVKDAPNGHIATLAIKIEKHTPSPRRGLPYRVQASDETGAITLVFFHANKDWIEKQLPIGADVIVSGRIEFYQGNPQMVHPDAIGKPEDRKKIETVEPIYPLTQGLTNKALRKSILGALGFVKPLPEWLDPAYKKQQKWEDWDTCIKMVHEPVGEKGLSPLSPARSRLAFDELLASQLTLALVRNAQRRINGRSLAPNETMRSVLIKQLPFELTGAQIRTLKEIDADMVTPMRMLRLVQGDVGCGKTVVAALAMLSAVENGAQAAIMAPTEILARQHTETLAPWLSAAGVSCVTLTGRDKGKTRDAILEQIASGQAQIIIGTHAIFQSDVEFADLALAVIDEQHRFGVHQRMELSSKGKGTDILVMTATPIPRTLALSVYGDMDISRIDEKPQGRKPIETLLISTEKIDAMVEGLKRKIASGARAYWVCPLVEESETLDLAAAQERYDILKHMMGDRIGLIHGRMKPKEKDAIMAQFINGEIDVLVATTVIEVGVDVPEATIMIIEHAERFGLSQLHQLRGRIGRGSDASFCFLLYSAPLGATAKQRLSIMRETEDGFLIAEKDMELRGGGDILGVRQSGMPTFKLADLAVHGELLAAARDDARLIIEKDPDLKGARSKALRTLLYLFERDQAIQYLQSG